MSPVKKYKILSLEGNKIYSKTHMVDRVIQSISVRNESGEIDKDLYTGYLSSSLETDKLLKEFKKNSRLFDHNTYIEYRNLINNYEEDDYPIIPILIDVQFNYPCSEFNRYWCPQGNRFVRFGYELTENDWEEADHCVFRQIDGRRVLVGIEVIGKQGEEAYTPIVTNQLETDEAEIQASQFFRVVDGRYKRRSTQMLPHIADGDSLDEKGIRKILYNNGFYVDGLHYVRYKRSAGSSREGHCLFIVEQLLNPMMRWTRCGLGEDATRNDIVSWEAYSALTLSEKKWSLSLPKESILIIRDQYSSFRENVVCVKKNQERNQANVSQLTSVNEECEITNNIFDGEGLLEVSCFQNLNEQYPNTTNSDNRFDTCGMVLLRNRLFKCCAFRTRIQKWFSDNGIIDVNQLNGYTAATDVNQIKLIVTESSVKYLKLVGINKNSTEQAFRRKAEEYINALFGREDCTEFGIVKTDKPTHYFGGDMVQTSYQFLSTVGLSREQVAQLYAPALDYAKKIKDDPKYMRYFLETGIGELLDDEEDRIDEDQGNEDDVSENDIDETDEQDASSNALSTKAILKLLSYSDAFARTDFYGSLKRTVEMGIKERLRSGNLLVDGTYATLFGNGAEFLGAVLRNPENSEYYQENKDHFLKNSQIYTKKFQFGKQLLCVRSPHITMGNLMLSENTECKIYDDYFELSNEIVCVNAIENNIQYRLNGCDYDSDTMLITDNEILVTKAREHYDEFLVPYHTLDYARREDADLASIDIAISNNKIGQIVNLSQYLNAKYWDIREAQNDDAKNLYKQICILEVMSNTEIDKAKRVYDIDVDSELRVLKEERTTRPDFYVYLTNPGAQGDGTMMNATMQYIYDLCRTMPRANSVRRLELSDLVLIPRENDGSNDYKYANAIEDAVERYSTEMRKLNFRRRKKIGDADSIREQILQAYRECQNIVNRKLRTDGVLGILLSDIETGRRRGVKEYRSALFCFIVLEKSNLFIRKLINPPTTLQKIVRDETEGTINIYGHGHKIVSAATPLD